MSLVRLLVALVVVSSVVACGDDGETRGGQPTVVVTTSVLGDVVEHLVDDRVEVSTIMPPGASPHDFQPSARQVQQMQEADAVVVNGGGLEEGLADVIEQAVSAGVPVFRALDAVEPVGSDPHFFTDVARMVVAADGIAEFLASSVPALASDEVRAGVDAYLRELRDLDAEIVDVLADVAEEDRVLVTHHAVLGHFADRYGFRVVGTVIPGGSSTDAVSPAQLSAIAEVVRSREVPAIFTDASSSDDLVDTLAAELDGVTVVELHTESLGGSGSGAETYVDMMRSDARRIADALA